MKPNLSCYNSETGKELIIFEKLNCSICGFILLTEDINPETGDYFCRKCKEVVLPKLPDGYKLTKPEEDPGEVKAALLKTLANNTQESVNRLCYSYCDAEQKAWGPKMIPEAQAFNEDNTASTPFIDAYIAGMQLEDENLDSTNAKEDLINSIIQNDIAYSEKLTKILGITTCKRDKIKAIAESELSNKEKINQMNSIDLEILIT